MEVASLILASPTKAYFISDKELGKLFIAWYSWKTGMALKIMKFLLRNVLEVIPADLEGHTITGDVPCLYREQCVVPVPWMAWEPWASDSWRWSFTFPAFITGWMGKEEGVPAWMKEGGNHWEHMHWRLHQWAVASALMDISLSFSRWHRYTHPIFRIYASFCFEITKWRTLRGSPPKKIAEMNTFLSSCKFFPCFSGFADSLLDILFCKPFFLRIFSGFCKCVWKPIFWWKFNRLQDDIFAIWINDF